MNIKALITALVLGSSSVAGAATTPYQAFEHRTLPSLGIGFLEHVVEKPAPQVLLNDTRIQGRTSFKVSTIRPFSKISLRANDGSTTVTRVVITYDNGHTRTVKGTVVKGSKELAFDIADSRAIKTIAVVGTSKRGASIDVFAI